MIRTNVQRLGEQVTGPFNWGLRAFRGSAGVGRGLPSGPGICGVIAVAVVAPDLVWWPLRRVVYAAWMSQPCRSSCMNGTFTSYAAVLMTPVGQVARRRYCAGRDRGPGPGWPAPARGASR